LRGDSLSALKNNNISVAYRFTEYTQSHDITPLFIKGDALSVLQQLPERSVDFCMTSPPYWGKRQYAEAGIGLEDNYTDYIKYLTTIFLELKRVMKETGSFWLNMGDSYQSKSLLGIPWRVAFELTDNQGWILRNEVIWNKVKGGPDNSKDKLGNVHEHIFHFVKKPKGYYYDSDSIRSKPSQTKVGCGCLSNRR
jgi:site-specific DNA-methyltransferase (adenine-specific)